MLNAHAAGQRHPIAPHPPRILCVIALLQSLFPIIHQWRQARLGGRKLNPAAIRAAHPPQRNAGLHQMRLVQFELPIAAPTELRAAPGINPQARRIGVRVIVLQREDAILPIRARRQRAAPLPDCQAIARVDLQRIGQRELPAQLFSLRRRLAEDGCDAKLLPLAGVVNHLGWQVGEIEDETRFL